MSYIGNEPAVGQWRKLTDISSSFDGVTTTFTTSVPPGTSAYYVTAGSASQLIISLGGVIQEPDVDYTVSTNSITFTTAPASGLSFFGVLCGDALNVGTPGDGSVTTSKLGTNLSVDLTSGSAATPSLTFDANTGLYSPGEDQVAISTGGTARLYIDSSGRVGIGTTAPSGPLNIVSDSGGLAVRLQGRSADGIGTFQFRDNGDTATQGYIQGRSTGLRIGTSAGNPLVFLNDDTEQMRVDSSGRLLVGTSTTSAAPLTVNGTTEANATLYRAVFGNGYLDADSAGVAGANAGEVQIQSGSSSRPALLSLGGGLASGEILGAVTFFNSNNTDGKRLRAYIRATQEGSTANEQGARLEFSTTADGASSPTERMRITSGGLHRVTQSGSYNEIANLAGHYFQNDNNQANGFIAWNNSFSASVVEANCLRAANSAYTFYYAASGNGSTAYADSEFKLRGDGTGLCDGSWTGGGADYAEYFEWSDANPNEEDRRGISVVLDGDKIREAVAGEDPIGVISGNPSVVGDAAWNKWSGKYLRDEFGSYLLDAEGYRQLNSAYNPDQEYISREQRPEWDCVGLMGKLRIRKGQVTGSRWIKMRDISDSVEEWLVR